MKKLFVSIGLLLMSLSVFGQSSVPPPLSLDTVTAFENLKHPTISEVVTQRVMIFTDVFGIKGTFVDWRGFGGFNLTLHNSPTAGSELIGYLPVAKQLTVGFGPVVEWVQSGKTLFGAALNFRFKPSTAGFSSFNFSMVPSPRGVAGTLMYGTRF